MSECICEGNWRNIIKESEPKFGKTYLNTRNDVVHTFIGVMHCEDDYYYCMMSVEGRLERLSCVGAIEAFDYEELP